MIPDLIIEFRMIFFSSAEVFGDYEEIISEDVMVNNPVKDTSQMNKYAITKRAGNLCARIQPRCLTLSRSGSGRSTATILMNIIIPTGAPPA